jgi:hypothetical protein
VRQIPQRLALDPFQCRRHRTIATSARVMAIIPATNAVY